MTAWTHREKELLFKGIMLFGQNFQKIQDHYANEFLGRTAGSLLTKWYNIFRLSDPIVEDKTLVSRLQKELLNEDPTLTQDQLSDPFQSPAAIKYIDPNHTGSGMGRKRKRKNSGSSERRKTKKLKNGNHGDDASPSSWAHHAEADASYQEHETRRKKKASSRENTMMASLLDRVKKSDEQAMWLHESQLPPHVLKMIQEDHTPLDYVYSSLLEFAPALSNYETVHHSQRSSLFDQVNAEYQKYYSREKISLENQPTQNPSVESNGKQNTAQSTDSHKIHPCVRMMDTVPENAHLKKQVYNARWLHRFYGTSPPTSPTSDPITAHLKQYPQNHTTEPINGNTGLMESASTPHGEDVNEKNSNHATVHDMTSKLSDDHNQNQQQSVEAPKQAAEDETHVDTGNGDAADSPHLDTSEHEQQRSQNKDLPADVSNPQKTSVGSTDDNANQKQEQPSTKGLSETSNQPTQDEAQTKKPRRRRKLRRRIAIRRSLSDSPSPVKEKPLAPIKQEEQSDDEGTDQKYAPYRAVTKRSSVSRDLPAQIAKTQEWRGQCYEDDFNDPDDESPKSPKDTKKRSDHASLSSGTGIPPEREPVPLGNVDPQAFAALRCSKGDLNIVKRETYLGRSSRSTSIDIDLTTMDGPEQKKRAKSKLSRKQSVLHIKNMDGKVMFELRNIGKPALFVRRVTEQGRKLVIRILGNCMCYLRNNDQLFFPYNRSFTFIVNEEKCKREI